MNKTIVLVQELDGRNTVIPASVVTRDRTIVNPMDISQNLALREADLRLFRFNIDNRSQMGVNTSAAEEKFMAAQSAVLLARNSTYSTSQAILNNVTGFIEEGEKLLEKAWAEKEIENAQAPITKTNDLITYFKVNMSVTNDPRLAIVIAKKESAEQYLSSAKDLLNTGNFEFSRQKSKEAFNKGNESLNDALNFKLELTKSGGALSWLNTTTLLIVVGIVIIIGIAGYFLLRNKNRWDDY
jgi:hypothetical protein